MAKLHLIKAVLLAMKVAVLLSSLFLCNSCTTFQRETPTVLLQAEALLQSHPDSAYALLHPIDPSTLDSIDWAHYYYLYTAAANKVGQHISWHKEMQRAADIYAPTLEEEDSKARVYYYAALALRENFAYTDAFRYYLSSLALQNENSPSRMLLFTYMGCYNCLYFQNLFVESLEYLDKTIQICELLEDNYILLWALHRKAYIYICLEMYDSSISYLEEYRQMTQLLDCPLAAEFYNTYSCLYNKMALYDKALLYSDSAYHTISLPGNIYAFHYIRAEILRNLQRLDSAEYYYLLSLKEFDIERRKEIYKGLLKITRNAPDDSIKIQQYADSFKVYSDLAIAQKATIPLQNIETQRKVDYNNKVISGKYLWFTYVVIILFISLISVLLKKGINLFSRKEKQISTLISTNQRLDSINTEIRGKYDQIVETQKHKVSAIQFESEILLPAIEEFIKTPYYNMIEQTLELDWKEKIGKQGQIIFRESIDKCFRSVVQVLEDSSGLKKINQEDFLYLILSYMKISPRYIAPFISCEADSLRKKRSRLRRKMKAEYFQIFFPS